MVKNLKADIQSSIVVFLVALPLCLGIALASQAPLASGLIAGIIGGLVISMLSGSQLSVSGPAAGLAVIVASSIQQLGDYRSFALAVFISGIFQIIFSLLKTGKFGNFFPTSVITGMLSAIGLLLILKQLPHTIGFDVHNMASEAFLETEGGNTFGEIIYALSSFNISCFWITVLSLFTIFGWDALTKKIKGGFVKIFPSSLLAVFFSVLFSEFFLTGDKQLEPEHLVRLPFTGGIVNFFSNFSFPAWESLLKPQVYVIALTVALVGSLESLLSLNATDKIDPEKRVSPKNQELFAQGVGNTISGFIGGLPITAVIVRSAANISAGAKSKLSSMFHGVLLLFTVLFIPHYLNKIPLATLAVILILVGYKLTKPLLYKEMYGKGRDQFIPFIVTIVAILFTDLLKGVAIGMVVGAYFVFKRNHHESIVVVNEGNDYLIRFMKDVSFIQKNLLVRILEKIPEKSSVIIDGSNDVFIDEDIIYLIDDFIKGSQRKLINIELRKSSTALSPYFKIMTQEN